MERTLASGAGNGGSIPLGDTGRVGRAAKCDRLESDRVFTLRGFESRTLRLSEWYNKPLLLMREACGINL